MKKLCFVLFILLFSQQIMFSQNLEKIHEITTLDSSTTNIRLARQAMVLDHNSIIHLYYGIWGEATDYIMEFTSVDNGNSWNGPDTVSVFSRPSSYDRVHIFGASAAVDDNNNIHLVYRYDGPPNYISGWDAYPSSHINYVRKIDGQWSTQQNVINGESVQAREGNGSTVCYLNDYQIMNFHNAQHFASYDYAWWGRNYHIIYSNNISGNWLAGDTLHTYDLGDYDNIILNAPSMAVNNDTLFAVWYQRYNCTIEMKMFDGVTWSNVQTIFNDKYYSAPHPTSYIVKTNSCQNNEDAVAAMLRTPVDGYNELILLSKSKNNNWQIDTTQLPETYYAVEPTIYQDTTYLYLYRNSTYTGSIVNYTKNGGFSEPITMAPENDAELLLDLKSLSDATIPFAYVVKNNNNNKVYLKIGRINNLITDVKSEETDLPSKFTLSQNYPNPFNPVTTISYVLSKDSDVTLTIYDITGRLIETLVNQRQNTGQYMVQWDASLKPSGVYFYKISTGEIQQVKKCLLIK